MILTSKQELELRRCMLLGLIQALHRTQCLTDVQFYSLMTDRALWNAAMLPPE